MFYSVHQSLAHLIVPGMDYELKNYFLRMGIKCQELKLWQ